MKGFFLKPFKHGIICNKIWWDYPHFHEPYVGYCHVIMLFFYISLPFLCKGVTSDNFKKEGKLADLIALLMFVHKNSADISICSLMVLVVISNFCEALVLSNFRIFFIFPYIYFFEMKYFVLAVFQSCKNAMVIFIFQHGFENWILKV